MSTIPWGTMNHWLYLDAEERAHKELERAAARDRSPRPKHRLFARTPSAPGRGARRAVPSADVQAA